MTELDLQDFEYIWDKWITPLVNDIFKSADSDFAEKCNLQTRELSCIKKDACKYFCERREEVKRYYYGENFSPNEDPAKYLLDFHKLSAVLCRTLIEFKVFDFNKEKCYEFANEIDSQNTDWLIKNVLINFRLAFYASVVFLYHSMVFMYSKKNQPMYKMIHEKLKENKKLNLYFPLYSSNYRNHESFENCMILDLAKRDLNSRSFDFLLYSTVMYQLEEYNKILVLFAEMSPDALKQFIEEPEQQTDC